MNPKLICIIIASIGALFGIGGGAYGYDQHKKRKEEQNNNNVTIAQLKTQLSLVEAEHAQLEARFGTKNEQVIILAAEVQKLRAKLAEKRNCGNPKN